MDEQDILTRLDARGRAAAEATHATMARSDVPPFDPDLVVVDVAAPPHPRRRWRAVAGVAAALVVLAGAVALVAGRDDDDPVVNSGPIRRFVADHLPEGFAPAFLSSRPVGGSAAMPAELYGPAPTDPRAAVGIAPDTVGDGVDFEPEGRPDWETARFGDRDGFVMSDEGLGWYGLMVVLDGRQVMVFGVEDDRPALELMAATVVLADGVVVADSPDLPRSWEGQGRVDDLLGAFAPGLLYGYGPGHSISYTGPLTRSVDMAYAASVVVSTTSGATPDVAAMAVVPWPGRTRADVTVRGRPGVIVGGSNWATSPEGETGTGGDELWMVGWVERPGEVIRVSATGVDRDEVLAVAEGLRPAEEGEWEELERSSLRGPIRSQEGEVVLGEGSFSDGSPWLLVVHPHGRGVVIGGDEDPGSYGEETETAPATTGAGEDEIATSGGLGVADHPAGDEVPPGPQVELRTTAASNTGTSSSWGGSYPEGPEPGFLDGASTGGDDDGFGWAYGLVSAEVATVELVAAEGEVLASVEVLVAEGFRGYVVELPRGLRAGPVGHEEPASVTAAEGGGRPPSPGEVPTTTAYGRGEGPSASTPSGPVLVARAADGTELERISIP